MLYIAVYEFIVDKKIMFIVDIWKEFPFVHQSTVTTKYEYVYQSSLNYRLLYIIQVHCD